MKKSLLALAISALIAECSYAQIAISADVVNSTPMYGKTMENVKGSAFLIDDWLKGNVRLKNKSVYTGMDLKYDVLNEKLLFLAKDNTQNFFKDPVSEFALFLGADIPVIFRNGFPEFDKNTGETFYQVLVDGNTKLLKQTRKSIIESIPYGHTVPEKTILKSEIYFLFFKGKLEKVKNDPKKIAGLLDSSEVDKYVKDKKLKSDREEDLIQTIEYFNTL